MANCPIAVLRSKPHRQGRPGVLDGQPLLGESEEARAVRGRRAPFTKDPCCVGREQQVHASVVHLRTNGVNR